MNFDLASFEKIIDYKFTSSFVSFIMSQNMNKKHWKTKNYIERNLFDLLLKDLRKKNINIYSSNDVIVFDKKLNYLKEKLLRATRNVHWKRQFNNKNELISSNERKNVIIIIINNVDEEVFVIKYENVELHDEKNYKINLLRRTKKRISNATNNTYEKKTLMSMTRTKLT